MGIRQSRTDKEIIQERAIKTRERLLAAALELYMVKGYHNTTVDEIAKIKTDWHDRPYEDQIIAEMTAETFGVEYPEPKKA